jgi:SAM-dependent methyltransferase
VDKNIYEYMLQVEKEHFWFVGRRRILKLVLDGILPPGRESAILELGCGTGGNIDLLSSYGDYFGLEPFPDAAQAAALRSGAKIIRGDLPDNIPFRGETFDLVAMLDVLEHLDDDAKALEAARSLLKPGGCALITVPAFMHLWSAHDRAHHHRRRYRRLEVARLVAQAGFKLERATYFNTFLYPLVATTRLAGRVTGREKGNGDLFMPNPVANRALTAIFSSEAACLGALDFPFGVSILAVGRRM